MICYFQKNLKPFIEVKMEQQDREFMNFEEMVQKAVNAKVKTGLRSSTTVRDLDTCCPRGHRLFHNTFWKMQIQRSKHFSCFNKSKPKDLKPALSHNNVAVPAKKEDKKDKKKRFRNQRRDHTKEQTSATGVNTEASKKKIKTGCFNYNKKGHYTNECIKLSKN